jgi:nitroreductase
MELQQTLRERRSIRAFTADPVPEELIREILEDARWSPSWANTQAWHVFVACGETLAKLSAAAQMPAAGEAPAGPDFRMPREWPPHLAARTKELFDLRSAFAASGAEAARTPAEFYGAPCVLYFATERTVDSDYLLFDSGLLAQSVCLAARDRGLGTCIMAWAVREPDALRAVLPGAADKRFVIAVALGYPDGEAPINRFERRRAPLEELVTWAK